MERAVSKRIITGKGGGGRLQPNHKGQRNGGRKPGVPNKLTQMIKDAVMNAAASVGHFSVQDKEVMINGKLRHRRVFVKGEGGVEGWLEWLAMHEPVAFSNLVGKVIPLQIAGKMEHDHAFVLRTSEEVAKELEKRGLPTQVFTKLIEHDADEKPRRREIN